MALGNFAALALLQRDFYAEKTLMPKTPQGLPAEHLALHTKTASPALALWLTCLRGAFLAAEW